MGRLLPTNCLIVFDSFVGLELKGLKLEKIDKASADVVSDSAKTSCVCKTSCSFLLLDVMVSNKRK